MLLEKESRTARTVREGEDGVDAKIQSRQALQVGQLELGVLFGDGPATTHYTAGVHPAVTLKAAVPRVLKVDKQVVYILLLYRN